MKRHLLLVWCVLFLSPAAFAEIPDSVVKSCLMLETVDSSAIYERLDDVTMELSDDELQGYTTYSYRRDGVIYGYAASRKGSSDLLIIGGRKFATRNAKRIGKEKPIHFDAAQSGFGLVRENGHRYFCITSNFEGLGRSGSFKNVRAAYIVSSKLINKKEVFNRSYYVVRDVRKFNSSRHDY